MNIIEIASFIVLLVAIETAFYYLLACILWFSDQVRGKETSFKEIWDDFFWDERTHKYEISQGIFTWVFSPLYFVMAFIFLIFDCLRKLFEPLTSKMKKLNKERGVE